MLTPKVSTKSAIFWNISGSFYTHISTLLFTILIARFVSSADFGVFAFVTMVPALCSVIIAGGLQQALIRADTLSEEQFSSVFAYNIILAALLYSVIWIFAPIIEQYYALDNLTNPLRIGGLLLFMNATTIVPLAKLNRDLKFDALNKTRIASATVSGVVGVILAISGWGIWALVVQVILLSIVNALVFWWLSKWVPTRSISVTALWPLLKFGNNLTLSSLIAFVQMQFYIALITGRASVDQTGFYSVARRLTTVFSEGIISPIQQVNYAALSKTTHDIANQTRSYRHAVSLMFCVSSFVGFGIFVFAPSVGTFVLGPNWQVAAEYAAYFGLVAVLFPGHSLFVMMMQISNRTDIHLKATVVKFAMAIAAALFAIQYGVLAVILSQIVVSFCASLLNVVILKRIWRFPVRTQISDILGPLMAGAFTAALMSFFVHSFPNIAVQVILGIPVYLSVFIVLLRFIAPNTFRTAWSELLNIAKR